MTKKKKFICGLMIIFMCFSSFTMITTFANSTQNDIEKLNRKIDSLNRQLEQTQRQINQNRNRQKTVYQEIQKLDIEIEKIQTEIELLTRRIATTEKEVATTTKLLIEAEENIVERTDLFSSRLSVMYKSGNLGYLEVLLSSRDFLEFLSNLDMIKRIVMHDVDLLKFLQEERDKIEDKKVQLENHREKLFTMKNQVDSKRKDLVVSRSQQERLRRELVADTAELERQYQIAEEEIAESVSLLRRLQSNTKYIGGVMQWPVPGHTNISSPYGYRIHPILRTRRFHTGIDIPAPTGTEVQAATMGRVVFSGTLGSYGKTIIIDHGGGILTLYAHNSRLVVSEGDDVVRGQKIAEIGSTGLSTGPHLHFEVRKNGEFMDPIPYVRGKN